MLGGRLVHVVVLHAILEAAAARRICQVIVVAKILGLEVVMMRWRRWESVQGVVQVIVVVQVGHVITVHTEWWGERSMRMVASEFRPVWRVRAVEVLWVTVEGDGVGREAEPRVDHARRKSSHSRPSCIGR